MLCSYNIEDEKINLFTIMIDNSINGNKSYESRILSVLLQSKDFLDDKKDIFSIDRNYFSIIIFLAKSHPEVIKKINFDKLSVDNLLEIKSILAKHKQFSFS